MNSELTQWLEENLEKNDLLLTPEYSMNEVTMSGAMLYCGWPYYAWSAGYDTNYRAAQAVTIYTTSDSETLKKTVQQEKITYILFEEGSNLNSRNVVRRQLLQHMKRFMRLRMGGYGSIKQQNNPQMHYYGNYSGFMIMSRVITDLQR